jgi:uncharacterized protein YydD (DUF2326 family)
MQLLKIYSNKSSFRTVDFNPTGPSFIVARQQDPTNKKKGRTYNGVGKSLLIRIIHFCLGAKTADYQVFCQKLEDWEFYLDFQIKGAFYTIKRTTKEPKILTINDEVLELNEFKNKLGLICFELPSAISQLSFRSLLPFFLRPNKESYNAYNKPGKVGNEYQSLLYNAFLLGLDVNLVKCKYDLRQEKIKIDGFEKSFKTDPLLLDYFTGNKDVSLSVIELNESIIKLQNDLNKYQVSEDYSDIQKHADKIEGKLFELNNRIILIQNKIANIDINLKYSPDININDLKRIYEESKIYFSSFGEKSIEDMQSFYKSLLRNRNKKLSEQQNRLKKEEKEKLENSKKLQDDLDRKMKFLGEHQALDMFLAVNNEITNLQIELDSLLNYEKLLEEFKSKKRNLKKNHITATENTEKYLENIKSETEDFQLYFRYLAKLFYPESSAGLTINNNERENQIRFDIEAKIESDASDGIGNVKIFCYDLTLLLKGSNHNIDFIFHDSRLFSEIDERQKRDMFLEINKIFAKSEKQYIATINENQLNEIRRQLSENQYNEMLDRHIILELTDDSDEGKLLGIKVDIPKDK